MKVTAVLWLVMAAGLLFLPSLTPPQIEIEWITGSEYNTVGFNIYRAEAAEGPFTRLNDSLIPAEGGAAGGGRYQFVDEQVTAGQRYYYMLEDIEFDGRREQHDPIVGQASDTRRGSWPLAAVSLLAGVGLLFAARREGETRRGGDDRTTK